jgi:hypothetical protein
MTYYAFDTVDEMTDYKRMFEQAVCTLAAIDEAPGYLAMDAAR